MPTVTILAEGVMVRNRLWEEGVRRLSSSILNASVSRNVVDVSATEELKLTLFCPLLLPVISAPSIATSVSSLEVPAAGTRDSASEVCRCRF